MYSKEKRWYHKTLSSEVSIEARQLLESYSHIPKDEIDGHIYRIRDIAWEVAPFPCVGQFKFLSLNLYHHPKYDTVLQRVKCGAKLLDLGCCVGQDIRKLIHDGAPSDNIYGSDLFPGYFDVGYELFNDKETCKVKFFAADIFDDQSALRDLDGRMDLIHTGLFFHMFDWQRQLKVAIRIISLLKAQPGSMLIGSQIGALIAGDRDISVQSSASDKRVAYLHDLTSFERFWKEVEVLTGISLHVEVTAVPRRSAQQMKANDDMQEGVDRSFFGPGTTWLRFSIEKA